MKRIVETEDGEIFEVVNLFGNRGVDIDMDSADAVLEAKSMVVKFGDRYVPSEINLIRIYTIQ